MAVMAMAIGVVLGVLVGAALMWLVVGRRGALDPPGTSVVHVSGGMHSSGAIVPWSTGSAQTSEALRALVPTTEAADMVTYGDPGPDGQGFVLEIVTSLRSGDLDLPFAAQLPTIAGPIARAVQALAGSERLVGTLMQMGGYAVVKVPRGSKWMVANGHKVAQVFGKGSQAGARAQVVGFAGVGAVAPELIAVGAALAAEYVLVAKIEQAGRVASLVHQRQVSEALAAGDAGRALVARTRNWSEDARDWPEILVRQLVDCHAELALQARASNRMRDLVLAAPDDAAEDERSRPAKPGSGDAAQAGAELTAGYEVHASAAQVAAVRLEHAIAHGDEATASVLFLELAQHLDDLREHHRILTEVSEQRRRWFKTKWGSTVESITKGYTPLVDRLGSDAQFMLTIGDDGTPELRALPPSMLELPESTSSATNDSQESAGEGREGSGALDPSMDRG
jgi:hypothetical protein